MREKELLQNGQDGNKYCYMGKLDLGAWRIIMNDTVNSAWEKYPAALPKDTILAGKYVIKNVLGQGGFGITYLAESYKTGLKAAVKEFFPETMAMRSTASIEVRTYTDERRDNFRFGMESFLEEAKVLAQFQGNPHIVGVQEYFEENGTAYFVMDYIEGIDFKTYIKQNGGKLSWEEVWKIMSPVMDALDAVHKKGLVHRDVTPDNIFISNDGMVKLIDFGAARYSLGDRSKSLDVILKPGYAPKEQYTRRGKQGAFTDVYSAAACFYSALCGYIPPESLDRMEEDDLVPLSNRGVNLPDRADEAIIKALEVRAEDRYQTMAAFKQAVMGENVVPVQNPTENKMGSITESVTGNKTGEKHDADVINGGKASDTWKKIAITVGAAALCVIVGVVAGKGSSKKSTDVTVNQYADEKTVVNSTAGNTLVDNTETKLQLAEDTIANDTPLASTETKPQSEEEPAYVKNVLMEDFVGEEWNPDDDMVYVLGNEKLKRSSIATITFLDTLADMPDDAWDVSKDKNGLVMAWAKPSGDKYDLYIAAEGGVCASSGKALFAGYMYVTEINFNNCFHTEKVTDMSMMFSFCINLPSLDVRSFDTSNVSSMALMFGWCDNLPSLDVSSFDTSNVTDMSGMFCGCSNLPSLDVSSFDTSNVTDMSDMFASCSNLPSLDVSSFDTSNVTGMTSMFANCSNLPSLDVSVFDTSNVTNMRWMFENCSKLTSLDLSNFDTSNVTSMLCMFAKCESLRSLDLSSFNTSNVTNMRSMFASCSNLSSLDLSSFDTSNVTDIDRMFADCESLASLDLSSFDTSKVEDMDGMFTGAGITAEEAGLK
ncbi:MAG: BspA family leucine-rich repeat surface protein [Muribaculaceae bacterium]|nr:BspA family leucine-rich repeat surface protein [Muribaculaceae bacterium]